MEAYAAALDVSMEEVRALFRKQPALFNYNVATLLSR